MCVHQVPPLGQLKAATDVTEYKVSESRAQEAVPSRAKQVPACHWTALTSPISGVSNLEAHSPGLVREDMGRLSPHH